MTVDKLDENRVLIILCEKDMEDFSLDYDKMDMNDLHSRKVLMRIMQLACFKSGIEINGKKILLEAVAGAQGCYLLVTVDENRKKKYRLKSTSDSICYSLGTSGNFLDSIEKLYRQNVCCNRNSAYEYNGEYYLIFDYPSIPQKLKRVLSEYGERRRGNLIAADIRENGRLLYKTNAILGIGKYLV